MIWHLHIIHKVCKVSPHRGHWQSYEVFNIVQMVLLGSVSVSPPPPPHRVPLCFLGGSSSTNLRHSPLAFLTSGTHCWPAQPLAFTAGSFDLSCGPSSASHRYVLPWTAPQHSAGTSDGLPHSCAAGPIYVHCGWCGLIGRLGPARREHSSLGCSRKHYWYELWTSWITAIITIAPHRTPTRNLIIFYLS